MRPRPPTCVPPCPLLPCAGSGAGVPSAAMEAELEKLERKIKVVEKEIKKLSAGHPERVALQGRLTTLEERRTELEKQKTILQQAQGAILPSVTHELCIALVVSPPCCLRTLSGASDRCSSITLHSAFMCLWTSHPPKPCPDCVHVHCWWPWLPALMCAPLPCCAPTAAAAAQAGGAQPGVCGSGRSRKAFPCCTLPCMH